jgi:outer membrane protein
MGSKIYYNYLTLSNMKRFINVYVIAAALLFSANNVQAQQKIGHLDSQLIFTSMPEAKAISTTLESLQKTKQAEIEKLQGTYTAKYNAAVAKNKTLNEANKETVGKELQVMGTELDGLKRGIDEATQNAQQVMVAKQGELMNPLQTKFITAVKAVAKEKGIAYVFDSNSQQSANNLLAYESGVDITAAVKAKLGIPAGAAPAKKS